MMILASQFCGIHLGFLRYPPKHENSDIRRETDSPLLFRSFLYVAPIFSNPNNEGLNFTSVPCLSIVFWSSTFNND